MLRTGIYCTVALVAFGAVVVQAQTTPEENLDQIEAESRVKVVASDYWLGIMAIPADELLRKQLNLPDKEGLIVTEVIPKGPAAAAGIARHDILLRFGQHPLGDLINLIQAVEEAKDTPQKVELLRGGKRLTVEVTPAKRPKAGRLAVDQPSEDDWAIIQHWIEGMRANNAGQMGRVPVRFRFYHPGPIVPKKMIAPPEMPENLSFVIRKNGRQPARIEVRRDDEKWELTENELDKLPKDVRPFIERMLGGGMMLTGGMKSFDMVPDVMMPVPGQPRGGVVVEPEPLTELDPQLERRFNEMNRRMDRMIEMMEKMFGEKLPLEEEDEN